jgi:HSP20 family protein
MQDLHGALFWRSDGSGYRLFERRYGRFERSFTLPRTVNADQVKAQFDNGVLTIHLPKAETAKPRRIAIEAGNGSGRVSTK